MSCCAYNQANTGVPTEGKFFLSSYLILELILQYRRNPLGSAVAIAALDVLTRQDKDKHSLIDRAESLGNLFRDSVRAINSPLVKEVRGRGLLNAVVIDESKSLKGRTAWQLCLLLKEYGVLAKPTHRNM
jgi:ornithine--oxo-acid transaminase